MFGRGGGGSVVMGVTEKNRNINMECRRCSKCFFFSISRFGGGRERPCLKLFLDLKNEGVGLRLVGVGIQWWQQGQRRRS